MQEDAGRCRKMQVWEGTVLICCGKQLKLSGENVTNGSFTNFKQWQLCLYSFIFIFIKELQVFKATVRAFTKPDQVINLDYDLRNRNGPYRS